MDGAADPTFKRFRRAREGGEVERTEHVPQGSRLGVRQQDRLIVKYDDVIVGDFRVDLIVENQLLIEIKTVTELSKTHDAQLYNYLKASKLKLGLLLNFGAQSVQISRRVNGF